MGKVHKRHKEQKERTDAVRRQRKSGKREIEAGVTVGADKADRRHRAAR